MTEAEWLACTDPQPMLKYAREKVSDRKLRLLAVACCRRFPLLLAESKEAADVAERLADGNADGMELNAARIAAMSFDDGDETVFTSVAVTATDAWEAIEGAISGVVAHAVSSIEASLEAMGPSAESWLGSPEVAAAKERASIADLVREILPNPFEQVAINSVWLSSSVVDLRQHIYRVRSFDRLPLLADALEDAGCTDAAILSHCRGPGPHVRGCWVVDLLLGKQ